ncbi:vam6/Vps39-like protein [Littorina saxatilis]|uniref:CNH domain-containing protein n=1 Tax=Littorina saxatilis TaxID=31220 RepID=A0AAN9BF22_9CAEN
MHDAFEADPILDKLPLGIESVACYENILLVGTKQGHLLQYKITRNPPSEPKKYHTDLERSNKSFSKKPITQIVAVPELFILISLSDNVISVHDLVTFNSITTVHKTKGATLFAVDCRPETTQTGSTHYLRVGVASKRKIQLFFWKNRDFHELLSDLSLYDYPHALSWSKDSLCVGFKRDYYIINSTTGSLKELFPVGVQQAEPLVARLRDQRLLLQRDKMSIFINAEGEPTQREPINWSDIPIAIEHYPPYLVAVLPKFVEVRTIDPKLMIQNLQLPKARLICQGSGVIYVASQSNLWRLQSVPASQQIRDLLQNKQFELALKLAEQADEPPHEREKRVRNINNLYAFQLFCQHRFEESLQLFAKLGTDPSHVIGLYPNLLPQDYRSKLEYPERVPELEGHEMEKAVLALIEYLTQKRNEVMKNDEVVTTAIVEGNTTIKSKKQLSQIIDTTLLKCYLQTNDALVAPLLRLKDNNCHVEESERVLKKKEKFSELIILYEKKGLHQKALSLLMKQAVRPDSPLKGHERTVQYLQHLGAEHLDLIFEYAEWVLQRHPEDGLKIFTEDTPEIETLPRDKVLDYLEKINPSLAIPYLEHVIEDCEDETAEFHNRLVLLLKDRVQEHMESYLNSLPEGHTPSRTGEEVEDLGKERAKLIHFLRTSTHYQAERLLTRFPLDGFHEERAILLGRLGRHEQALAIYIYLLNSSHLAEGYCENNYDPDREESKDVYLYLLKMYLQPPDMSLLGLAPGEAPSIRHNTESALRLLEKHAHQVDVPKALELLPSSIRVRDILTFLENVLEHNATERRHNQVLRSLSYAENLAVTEQRIQYQRIRVDVTEDTFCPTCKKRIGESAFYYTPEGSIYHYSCYKGTK